jgi:hypothetical protein
VESLKANEYKTGWLVAENSMNTQLVHTLLLLKFQPYLGFNEQRSPDKEWLINIHFTQATGQREPFVNYLCFKSTLFFGELGTML